MELFNDPRKHDSASLGSQAAASHWLHLGGRAGKASAVHSPVGRVVWAQLDTLEPPIVTTVPVPRVPPTPPGVSPSPEPGHRLERGARPRDALPTSPSFSVLPDRLGRSLNITGPQFPHLYNGSDDGARKMKGGRCVHTPWHVPCGTVV